MPFVSFMFLQNPNGSQITHVDGKNLVKIIKQFFVTQFR